MQNGPHKISFKIRYKAVTVAIIVVLNILKDKGNFQYFSELNCTKLKCTVYPIGYFVARNRTSDSQNLAAEA